MAELKPRYTDGTMVRLGSVPVGTEVIVFPQVALRESGRYSPVTFLHAVVKKVVPTSQRNNEVVFVETQGRVPFGTPQDRRRRLSGGTAVRVLKEAPPARR